MRSLNFTKIIAILAFMGLAGFSCFWTAESLYMWLPSLTIYGAWLIAVVFFIVASICFGKLLKALDRQADFYGKLWGRTGAFLLAFLGLMVFWLCVSVPTNTHTLLYKAAIKNVIVNDLQRTQGYLLALRDNNVAIKTVEKQYKDKELAVNALFNRLDSEINNRGAEGIGHRFELALQELEQALSIGTDRPCKIQRQPDPGHNKAQWIATAGNYKRQATNFLTLFRARCDKEIADIRATMNSKELTSLITNNNRALKDIDNMKGIDKNIISAVEDDLGKSYGYIQRNSQFISFKGNDKERYTRAGAMPEAKEMLSVPDVWKDYLTTDKFAGHGFIWWVLIAILVDISGFIFFNMAFNSKNNNAIA